MKSLLFDVSSLVDKPTGTKEVFSFDTEVELEGLKIKSNLKGKLEIMRIEEGFNVKSENFSTTVEFICGRCLKKFKVPIQIPFAERIFLIEKPMEFDDSYDLYLIDKKNLTVNPVEMFRQEIILHSPLNPVCSKSCKGLPYENIEAPQNKPLAILKDLLK